MNVYLSCAGYGKFVPRSKCQPILLSYIVFVMSQLVSCVQVEVLVGCSALDLQRCFLCCFLFIILSCKLILIYYCLSFIKFYLFGCLTSDCVSRLLRMVLGNLASRLH